MCLMEVVTLRCLTVCFDVLRAIIQSRAFKNLLNIFFNLYVAQFNPWAFRSRQANWKLTRCIARQILPCNLGAYFIFLIVDDSRLSELPLKPLSLLFHHLTILSPASICTLSSDYFWKVSCNLDSLDLEGNGQLHKPQLRKKLVDTNFAVGRHVLTSCPKKCD